MRLGSLRAGAVALAILLAACAASRPGPVVEGRRPTPLEHNRFSRPSTSREIETFLAGLAAGSSVASVHDIGRSALGAPMQALVLTREPAALAATPPAPTKLTVLLIGSQHGTEPSGSEALLRLARDVVDGPLTGLLDQMSLILIVNGNPDGRDQHRRVNGSGVNLSTNFTVLSEPEARAAENALWRWRPDALLDVHESAVFKGKTLARQGYMTDVEAQLEIANNPNVDADLAALSRDQILPAVLTRIRAHGLGAERYIGEIVDLSQPVTHGGLTIKNLRNTAGMLGTVSFLVENRLDPKTGTYATPRNLGGRTEKQYLSVVSFLAACAERRDEIRRRVRAARAGAPKSRAKLHLVSTWAPDPAQPEIRVKLRPVDGGADLLRPFVYHGAVRNELPLDPPRAYVVLAHQEELRRLFERHHIRYEVLAKPVAATAVVQRVRAARPVPGWHGWGYMGFDLDERRVRLQVPEGALWIPAEQPAGRRVPLLLDPRSNSSVFQEAPYASYVQVGEDFFVARVD